MPTVAQVLNRGQTSPPDRHVPAFVTVAGNPAIVALDPGSAETLAVPVNGTVHPVGARVLVVLTTRGNWIVGTI